MSEQQAERRSGKEQRGEFLGRKVFLWQRAGWLIWEDRRGGSLDYWTPHCVHPRGCDSCAGGQHCRVCSSNYFHFRMLTVPAEALQYLTPENK